MAKISKRGQGLGFIAVIVLIALLYFIFRYNVTTFEFTMKAGSHQAQLVESYAETEKAKIFAETTLQQSAYETLWSSGVKSCDFTTICTDSTGFINNLKPLFENYISMYLPSTEMLNTEYPDYVLIPRTCEKEKIEIEAYGYSETCSVKSDFPTPKIPCEDQENEANCSVVQLMGGGKACTWDMTNPFANCTETKSAPDCSLMLNQTDCEFNIDCRWRTSYAEDISVISAPLVDYQFRINSNAHFIGTIDCASFNAFINLRKIVVKPTCTLDIAISGQAVTFNVNYKDDSAPKEITVVVNDSSGAETAKLGPDLSAFSTDLSDSDYLDVNVYSATKAFDFGTFNATVDCKDSDDNSASQVTKSFTVA